MAAIRDPLDGVRPGGRRSWWLREALAAESEAVRGAGPPLVAGEELDVDVAILGGGYTGMWTAWHLLEAAPDMRIAILERDICGGGASGRNGGFLTGWWDELPTLVERFGEAEGVRLAHAVDEAVNGVGAWCEQHGVDAWYRKDGYLQVSAAPAQDGGWDEAVELCQRLGVGERYVALSEGEVTRRVRSPVFRAGVFMPGAATVQPAALARGLRRLLLERGVRICEGAAARMPERRDGGRYRIATRSSAGAAAVGVVRADQVVVGLNAWAAGQRGFGARLVAWSSYIVLTEPLGERLDEIGWTGGEGLTDARFTLHYGRTTPDGRIALGGGGGRAGYGGRIGRSFTADVGSARRAAAGLRRWFPSLADVRIDDAWGGPIDIASDHLPFFGTVGGGGVHFGHGYSGNGVAPSWLGGRVLAGLVLGRRDAWTSLALVGARPRAFPPEPFRSIGARVVREAIVRRELAEEAGRRAPWWIREISRLPRRMGYHLGPAD